MQTVADSLLPQHHQLAQVNFETLPFDVFKNFEPMVLNDAAVEAVNPLNVPKGPMKMVKVLNNQTGRVEKNIWIGKTASPDR